MVDANLPCTVRGVHHLGIAVNHLETAMRFYQEVFGIPPAPILQNDTYAVRGSFLPAGDVYLELLQGLNQESAISRFIQAKGEGLHHVCLEVEDIRQTLALLKAKGVRLVDQEPRQGFIGQVAFVHPTAARGILIELAQHGEAVSVSEGGTRQAK